MIASVGLALAWYAFHDTRILTATDLMREFKKDRIEAMEKYEYRKVTFKAVLKKPPWEKALYQHECGSEAMVYFVTDDPDEWLFCIVPYNDKLRDLKEGGLYRVSGIIYDFEKPGKLFLHYCSMKMISASGTPE